MGNYSLIEARDQLPALLAAAERGERVTITRDGAAVAELRPVAKRVPKPVTPEAVAELLRQLDSLRLPPQAIDAGTFVRAMRDEEDGF